MPILKSVDQKTDAFTQWNTTQQKEGTPTFHDSMDRSGEHYAKWNKPGGEGQIPYDLNSKWNLSNKTNKHPKYNQRHGNKEQTDVARGERWGG